MGLAASQGRFLCLTARMNDLVYEGQQIAQQRMALAAESKNIADAYNNAMNNKILQCTTPANGTTQLTYETIINQDPNTGLCMRIVDVDGNVVSLPESKYLSVSSYVTDEEGNETINTEEFKTIGAFISKYLPDMSDDEISKCIAMDVDEFWTYYGENYSVDGISVSVKSTLSNGLKGDDERYCFDENCRDPQYLQDMLTSGQWLLQQVQNHEWESIVWQGSTMISEVYDTSDDAAAEATYEAAMKDLQKKDKLLELRLEDVETQEQSVEKQIDSIKEVISKNIEDTYKTFA